MNVFLIFISVVLVVSIPFNKRSAASLSFSNMSSQSYKQRLRRGFIWSPCHQRFDDGKTVGKLSLHKNLNPLKTCITNEDSNENAATKSK